MSYLYLPVSSSWGLSCDFVIKFACRKIIYPPVDFYWLQSIDTTFSILRLTKPEWHVNTQSSGEHLGESKEDRKGRNDGVTQPPGPAERLTFITEAE